MATPETTKCPDCGKPLSRVTYSGGYLNEDQWHSIRAGDWYCETCPSNGRGNTSYRYFWDREVAAPVSEGEAAAPTDTERLDWLGEHAMRNRGEREADISVEYAEGEGFRVREWGKVEYDDEGLPDWRNRFYRSTLHPSLRAAIDYAAAALRSRASDAATEER